MKKNVSYVAFLRGINVGGNKKMPMADLKKMLERAGFANVKTLLASGNVLFESPVSDIKKLKDIMGKDMEKTFGFCPDIIIRTKDQIQKLIASDPFKKIKVTPMTRLYVTFLSEKSKSTLKIPYVSPQKDFTILKLTNGEIISVMELIERGTVDAMEILEKEFGKKITTRNWNTVLKTAQ